MKKFLIIFLVMITLFALAKSVVFKENNFFASKNLSTISKNDKTTSSKILSAATLVKEITRPTYQLSRITGNINVSQFSKFTTPSNHQAVYALPGRNLFMKAGGDVFDWGFSQLTKQYAGTHNISNLPWTKLFLQVQAYPPKFGINWTNWGQGNEYEKVNFGNLLNASNDFHCINGCKVPPAAFVQLDFENIYTPNFANQENANIWTAVLKNIRQALTYENGIRSKVGAFIINPLDNAGAMFEADFMKAPVQFPTGTKVQMTLSSQNRGMPTDLVGHEVMDYTDFSSRGYYYNMRQILPDGIWKTADGSDYELKHRTQNIDWLAQMLQYQQALRIKYPNFVDADGTHRTLSVFMTHVEDGKNAHYYYNAANKVNYWAGHYAADYPIPPEIMEGTIVMFYASGGKGLVLWGYVPQIDLTPNIGISPIKNGVVNPEYFSNTWDKQPEVFNNKLIYSSVEASIAGLKYIFDSDARKFLENPSIYLNEKTEVDYLDNKGYRGLNCVQVYQENLPQILGVVQGNEMLVVAQKSYARDNYSKTFRVRYNGKEQELTLTGKYPKMWIVSF